MIRVEKKTMGMIAIICITDKNARKEDIEDVWDFFQQIDNRFSTYKDTSEVEQINRKEITTANYSSEMKKILRLAEKTKMETNGYFDVYFKEKLDPSGIVKGYAINKASKMLKAKGYKNYCISIGGDIDARGNNQDNTSWKVGIKNPFNTSEIVKVLYVSNMGVATSGNYEQGTHIMNPKDKTHARDIASITVIGPTIYDADRMATAAFAMGSEGIKFIEELKGYEAYMVSLDKQGISTSGLKQFLN